MLSIKENKEFALGEATEISNIIQKIEKNIAKEKDEKILKILHRNGVKDGEIALRCSIRSEGLDDIILIDGVPKIKIERNYDWNDDHTKCITTEKIIELTKEDIL